jgi:hypothetical protein
MTRAALEHVLRAASAVSNEKDIVVIGSQAILGQFPEAPADLLSSIEVDVYPRDAPDKSDVIDGALGELSAFHEAFGYYAHGVDHTTAVLPEGWANRLVRVESASTGWAVGWCLEVHDLAVSKLIAGRDKDVEFVAVLIRERMIDARVVEARIGAVPITDGRVAAARARIRSLARDM